MYAVIKSGGKQYKVEEGQTLRLETLDVEEGKKVNFDQVLLIADGDKVTVGAPTIKGAEVAAEVVGHGRGKKLRVIKFRRRKNYRRVMGHRQDYTQVKITGIKKRAAAKKTTDDKAEAA